MSTATVSPLAASLHCPSWCTSHNSMSFDRVDGSCSHFHEVGDFGGISAVTTADGEVREAPTMYVNDLLGGATTPQEARQVAAGLVEVADVVERLLKHHQGEAAG